VIQAVDPQELMGWEAVLQSPVAVALLLLAGLITITGPLLLVVRSQYLENKELNREFREHLRVTADFHSAFANAQAILHLQEMKDARPDETARPHS
jgi:hypothetical protein